jgi:hypothetical protein
MAGPGQTANAYVYHIGKGFTGIPLKFSADYRCCKGFYFVFTSGITLTPSTVLLRFQGHVGRMQYSAPFGAVYGFAAKVTFYGT